MNHPRNLLRRQWLSVTLFFFLLLPLGAQEADRSRYQLLWEITAPHLPGPSYLFGSMHAREAGVFDFPDSLVHYLYACDALANEVHFDSAMHQMLRYEFGERPRPYERSQPAYDELQGPDSRWQPAAEDSVFNPLRRREQVDAFLQMLTGSKEERPAMPTLLDAYLMEIGRGRGLYLFGLENIHEQIDAPPTDDLAFSGEDEPGLLNSFRQAADYGRLRQAYVSGDLQRIWDLMNQMDPAEQRDIERRNYHMVIALQPLMDRHRVFSIVGAAHLPGPHGIIRLLERRGYRLRPVTATFSSQPPPAPRDYVRAWQSLEDRDGNFQAELPEPAVPFVEDDGTAGFIHIDIGKGLMYRVAAADLLHAEAADPETYFFGDESMPIAKRDTLSTNPWLLVEYTSEEGKTDDEITNFRARIYRRGGRFYLVYAGAYLHRQLDHPDVKRVFDAFTPAGAGDGYTEHEDTVGAFRVRLPQGARHTVHRLNQTDADDARYDFNLHLYQGGQANNENRYFLSFVGLPPGEVFVRDEPVLEEGVDFILSYFGASPDSNKVEPDDDPRSCRGTVPLSDSLELRYRVLLRSNRRYLLAAEGRPGELDASPFFDSFSERPLLRQPLIPAALQEAGSVALPQPVADEHNDLAGFGLPYTEERHYFGADSLNGLAYFVSTFPYPELYRAPEDFLDRQVEDFVQEGEYLLRDSSLTLPTGQHARELLVVSDSTHLRQRALLLVDGQSALHLYVYGAQDQLQHPLVDSFLYSYVPARPLPPDQLWTPKLDTLLTRLQLDPEDPEVETVLDHYAVDTDEAGRLRQELLVLDPADADSLLLTSRLRLLRNRPAAEQLDFYHAYFPRLRRPSHADLILGHLSRSPEGRPLFAELLPLAPAPHLEYTDVFQPLFDSTALVADYLPALLRAFERRIYPQQVYFLLEAALNEGTLSVREAMHPSLLAEGDRILREWEPVSEPASLREALPHYVIDYYRAAGCADPAMQRQLLRFARRHSGTDTGRRALLALLAGGRKVPDQVIGAYARSAGNYLPLIASLSEMGRLDRLPDRYYDESRIARLLLEQDLSHYGLEADDIRPDGRYAGILHEQPVGYYRFRFRAEGEGERLAVVAGFPADPSEKGLLGVQYVNYTFENVSRAERQATGEQLLEAMEEW